MLVLSRKNREAVVIGVSADRGADKLSADAASVGHLVKVTVLEINGGNVRLGFEADASIPVHRLEVWEKMAAGVPPNGPTRIP
jgi:carbon storage regulator CsrA